MKSFLGLVLLIGTLLGDVDAYGYFPYGEQEEAKLSAGMIVMIVFVVLIGLAAIGVSVYFAYQMEYGDDSFNSSRGDEVHDSNHLGRCSNSMVLLSMSRLCNDVSLCQKRAK